MKGRIIGIDYGKSRVGLATTDPLQIIVNALDTVDNQSFRGYIEEYLIQEHVVKLVFGKPVHADGTPTHLWQEIEKEVAYLNKKFPNIIIDFQDESFTSQQASHIAYLSGMKKKKRRDKKIIDKISAVLILQQYLGHI